MDQQRGGLRTRRARLAARLHDLRVKLAAMVALRIVSAFAFCVLAAGLAGCKRGAIKDTSGGDASGIAPADARVEVGSDANDAIAATDAVAGTDAMAATDALAEMDAMVATDAIATSDAGPTCPQPTRRDPPDFYPSLLGNCWPHLGATCVGADYCCLCQEVRSCGHAWTCGFTGGPGCPADEPTPGVACAPGDIARACNYCPGGELRSFRCAADGIWVKLTLGCPN